MRQVDIKKLVEETSQKHVASLLGVTQGAVWQMLYNKREVVFFFEGENLIKVEERKILVESCAV